LQAAIKALNSKDKAEIDRLMLSEVTRLFRLYVDASEKLSTYQLKSTAEQYAESQSAYQRSMTLAIVTIVVGIVLAGHPACSARGDAAAGPGALAFPCDGRRNLSNPIEVGRKDEMGEMMEGLQQMQERLAGTVRSVREGSDAIATASSEIAAGNLDLSRRTEQQAANLEETASSLEELTSTVKQNSDNARQANALAVGVRHRGQGRRAGDARD
jgi:methyl-accepting chemotaxis protein